MSVDISTSTSMLIPNYVFISISAVLRTQPLTTPAPTPASATSTPTTVPRSRRTAAPALLLVDAPDDAAEVAEDAPDDAAEAAEDAPDAEAAEDAPDNAAEAADDALDNAVKVAEDTSADAAEAVEDTLDDAAEAADDALDNAVKVAEDTSADAAEAVEDTLDDAAEAAEDAPHNVAGASEDAPDDAEAAEVALDDAAEAAENAPDNPAEAAENVPDDAVGDVPDDAAETAEDTSDDALEAAEVAAEVAEAAPEEADAVHTSAAMHYERSELWGIAPRSEGRGAGGVKDGDKGVPAAHSADWRARAACCSAVVHLLARHSAAASWNAVDEHTQDMSVLAVAERGRGNSGERENALAGAAARGNGALEAGEDARVDAAGLGGGGAKEGGEDKRPDEHRVLFSRRRRVSTAGLSPAQTDMWLDPHPHPRCCRPTVKRTRDPDLPLDRDRVCASPLRQSRRAQILFLMTLTITFGAKFRSDKASTTIFRSRPGACTSRVLQNHRQNFTYIRNMADIGHALSPTMLNAGAVVCFHAGLSLNLYGPMTGQLSIISRLAKVVHNKEVERPTPIERARKLGRASSRGPEAPIVVYNDPARLLHSLSVFSTFALELKKRRYYCSNHGSGHPRATSALTTVPCFTPNVVRSAPLLDDATEVAEGIVADAADATSPAEDAHGDAAEVADAAPEDSGGSPRGYARSLAMADNHPARMLAYGERRVARSTGAAILQIEIACGALLSRTSLQASESESVWQRVSMGAVAESEHPVPAYLYCFDHSARWKGLVCGALVPVNEPTAEKRIAGVDDVAF
ncbi:predicted protein [Postia placenta Mad-698-R]|uniref:Uncharacterized protein n=1 Tax=Postia placenta MAD-698-R-SB12 TaxID=670580 RepID=A0A1X6MYR5_9APHY|nr:hypothetical protein POSPLADRAFT_1046803 [Postia placenta MAD-698-R-SB12]EED83384.1 predicted protein [Postia placenta Mad-698-R]OSX61390.1 hypothetical protein POSPLADRAFT_1046803 [Postia placenta MAD-698-R-SB12]